jgi:hypothetical protein
MPRAAIMSAPHRALEIDDIEVEAPAATSFDCG